MLVELGSEEQDADALAEARTQLARAESRVDEAELRRLLGGEHDAGNAIVSINAGAGGTDACDWAEMLMRMYLRWAEAQGLPDRDPRLPGGRRGGHPRRHLHRVAATTPTVHLSSDRDCPATFFRVPLFPNLINEPRLPFGLRAVDGLNNHLVPGTTTFGASDQLFPRMTTPNFRPVSNAAGATDTRRLAETLSTRVPGSSAT